MRSATLVLGLGNPLRGDDGVGCRVLEELRQRTLPAGVQLLDGGTAGLELLDLMEGWDRVVVVDAADIQREPGEFIRIAEVAARLRPSPDPFSFHNAGLSEVLALAKALDRAVPEIVIYGVQPDEIVWREGLSRAVEDAVPALAAAVMREIRGEDHGQDSGD